MKRYWQIYRHYLAFMLKYMLEYRLNALARSLFFPAWQLALYGVVWLIYGQVEQVAGWNRAETTTIYLVVQIFFASMYAIYFEGGLRRMVWRTVRMGELDGMLVKPLNPQFQAMFSQPNISPLLSLVVLGPLFMFHLLNNDLVTSFVAIGLFLVVYAVNFAAIYFLLSAYSTIAFYTAQSRQVIEIIDKAFEFAHYPPGIFPSGVQLAFLSIVPVTYMGYASTTFLLSKGTPFLFFLSLFMLPVCFLINRWAWREGLKHYSSASS